MTTTSKDEVFTRFNLSFDDEHKLNISSGGIPFIIDAGALRLEQAWMPEFSVRFPEQFSRLGYLFNLYQQYTIESVDLEWVPRYRVNTMVRDPYNVTPTLPDPAASYYLDAFTSGEITMVQDIDDSGVRASIDEYFQARDQPNAKTFPMNSRGSYRFTPFVMDMIGQENAIGVQDLQGFNAANAINMTIPTKYKWFATKAAYANRNSAVLLNSNIGSLGVKVYYYTPFNTSVDESASFVGGLWRYNIKFAFKYPDYRGLINGLGMALSLENVQDMNTLSSMIGERARLQPMKRKLVPITNLGAAIQEHRSHTAEIPGPEREEAIRRLRRRLNLDEDPDEQSTQIPQDQSVDPVSM